MSWFLVFVIPSVLSVGVVYLPNDIILAWSFPTPETVKFELRVPQTIFDSYGWTGIGFKPVISGSGMNGADITNIIFSTPMQDSYGLSRGGPKSDIEMGGTCDLIYPDSHVDGRGIKYFWEKKLSTGDQYDLPLAKDQEFRLLYAVGQVSEGGVQMQHTFMNRGTIDIVLSENFRDTSLQYNLFSLI